MNVEQSIHESIEHFISHHKKARFAVLTIEETGKSDNSLQLVISSDRPLFIHIPQIESRTKALENLLQTWKVSFSYDPAWDENPILQIDLDWNNLTKVVDLATHIFKDFFGVDDHCDISVSTIDEDDSNTKTKDNAVIDQHFKYQMEIEFYYSKRNEDSNALNNAIKACQKQIGLAPKAAEIFRKENIERLESVRLGYQSATTAEQREYYKKLVERWEKTVNRRWLPAHIGYKQLAIIYANNNEYQKAIDISEQALKEGWSGDWSKRIERYRKQV